VHFKRLFVEIENLMGCESRLKRLFLTISILIVCSFAFVGVYWASEYYLVTQFAKKEFASSGKYDPSTIKIVDVQLLGSNRWIHLFQPHNWVVLYQLPDQTYSK
jgi:hypothetical protein